MKDRFKLERTAFSALTIEEADFEMRQHKNMSVKERFVWMHYLNSIAYNYPFNNPPKMLKEFSGARKFTDELYFSG